MADKASNRCPRGIPSGRGLCACQQVDRYPEAGRYYREGTGRLFVGRLVEYPILTLVDRYRDRYMLARVIHGGRSDHAEDVPEYARTDRAYRR